jgi:hypothetical protein
MALGIAVLSLYVLSTQAQQPSTKATGMVEDRLPHVVDGHILEWPDGRRFVTTLVGVRVIGQLPAATKSPFLVLAGRGCTDCDANVSIYIHSPSDGPMKPEAAQPRDSYPGKLSSYLDGTLLSESRMFWGRCLSGRAAGVIWYQREKQEDGTWKPSVYFVEIVGDNLQSGFLNPQPAIRTTLDRVGSGECRELPGHNMTSEP